MSEDELKDIEALCGRSSQIYLTDKTRKLIAEVRKLREHKRRRKHRGAAEPNGDDTVDATIVEGDLFNV